MAPNPGREVTTRRSEQTSERDEVLTPLITICGTQRADSDLMAVGTRHNMLKDHEMNVGRTQASPPSCTQHTIHYALGNYTTYCPLPRYCHDRNSGTNGPSHALALKTSPR